MLGDVLKQIIEEFPLNEVERKNKPFKDDSTAIFMRRKASEEIKNIIQKSFDIKKLVITFSPGQSQWTHRPWGGIRNKDISTSFMNGFYVVYLFQTDRKGVYLSLNQGYTSIENDKEIKDKIGELENRASFLRDNIAEIPKGFENLEIDCKDEKNQQTQAGNIISKYYPITDLNDEEMLLNDLNTIMDTYNQLIPLYKHKFLLKKNSNDINEGKNIPKIWKISPGDSDERIKLWPLYVKNGFIGIGWFESDKDYNDFKSLDEIKSALSEYYDNYKETNPSTAAKMIWNFTNEIKVGDWIIANSSKKKIFGIGIVKSDYIGPNDDNNPHLFDYFEHLRKVNWVITEELEFHHELFDQKTVTEIHEEKWHEIIKEYINKNPKYAQILKRPPIEDEDSEVSIKFSDIITRLKIDSRVLKQVCGALNSGKHIILTGAPGTGKTELAIDICKAAEKLKSSSGSLLTTATSDWTTFDTIGGYLPNNNAVLKFEDGIFLKAIKDDNWLIIDEINRAEIDKAFGQLFTVLSGQAVELPFLNENRERIKIFPASKKKISTYSEYSVSPNWRIIATMNVYDKDYLFNMSYAFLRRFSLIEIEIPDKQVYEKLIIEKSKEFELEEGDTDLIIDLLDINPIRNIGPAIYLDMIKYVAHRKDIEDEWSDIVEEAFLSFMLPQFEGIDSQKIHKIWNILPEELKTDNIKIKLQDFTLDELK